MKTFRLFATIVLVAVITLLSDGSALRGKSRHKRQDGPPVCDIADIIFVLDSSGSVGEDDWQRVLIFVTQIIANLSVGSHETRIGALYYSNRATVITYLNNTFTADELRQVILNTPWKDQETNTSGALWLMDEVMFQPEAGDRFQAPNVGIVITDGASNRAENLTTTMALRAKDHGATILALGIGTDVNDQELLSIASSTTLTLSTISFEALDRIQEQVISIACDIPVDCRGTVDLIFILDGSGSVRQENFDIMKNFVKQLLETLNVGPLDSRVGMITFSNTAHVEFHMNEYESRFTVSNAIDDVPYRRGTTNAADALRLLHEEAFTLERGDRAGVDNIALLFTDGGSNNFEETVLQAKLAREAGITLLVVAVSDWVNIIEITEIATDPDEYNVFNVDFNSISEISAGLEHIICNQVNDCSGDPCLNGGTCHDTFNRYYCKCGAGYAGPNCEKSCPSAGDIVIALDSSGSMGQENFFDMLDWIKHFVDNLNIGQTRLGLLTFANATDVKFNLDDYFSRQEIINVVSFPYSQGSTNTAAALLTMQGMFSPAQGDRPDVPNYGIVITDGQSNDRDQTFMQAVAARMAGINMISVGVALKSMQGQMELRGIASDPDDENVINVDDFGDLYSITDVLMDAVCNVEDSCAPGGEGSCEGGGTCVDGMNSYTCRCPPGRTGPNCIHNCDGQADIVFVVDGSGSIRENRFETIQEYIVSVIDLLEVSPERTRIGLVLYSDEAYTIFYLNTYSNKADIIHVVRGMLWLRAKTNTASGLRMMRENLFTVANGDREDVPNYAIVISDGESNVNPEETIPEAIESRIRGIHIIVVTVMQKPNLEMKGIASDPDDKNVLFVENFSLLPNLVDLLVSGMCDEHDECESSPCDNNGFCINGLYQYLCFCQDEFTGINCERRCGRRMDIVFVLDSSGSVEESFDLSLRLTRSIIEGLSFAGGRTRVGLLTYSDTPSVRFQLNQYSDKQSILNAIAFTQDVGQTNTAGGIDEMRLNMMTSFYGDRAGDPNYCVVITDGRSNINSGQTIPSANEARDADITMIAVGIGENGQVDRAELNGIANDPDNQYAFIMETEVDLQETATNILDLLCQ